jgi:hypothetical protein
MEINSQEGGRPMGFTRKTRNLAGLVDRQLLEKGRLGRGIVVSVQQTLVTTGVDLDPSHVCVFTVEVALDDGSRYTATCRQAVTATVLPRLVMPGVTVAVRVDPRDRSRIALSLGEDPPTVRTSGDPSMGSAAAILELGAPCRAVIVQSQPLGTRNQEGDDMYAFLLTVLAGARPPYQIKVGGAVPVRAMSLLYPSNAVPARRMTDGDDHEVVIDWDAALAEVTNAAA